MRSMPEVTPVEVSGVDVAPPLERLRDAASVEMIGRPITPLLKRFERAVVWEPKPVKVRVTKAVKADIERFERLWCATKFNFRLRRSRWRPFA